MNTFLPSPDFGICARVLDNARLLRQIQEASWVANHLAGRDDQGIAKEGNHPVFKLWKTITGKPLLPHLFQYLKALNREYQIRYNVTRDHASFARCYWMPKKPEGKIRWASLIHKSHRAKLIQKNPSHYKQVFRLYSLPLEEEMSYVWGRPEER